MPTEHEHLMSLYVTARLAKKQADTTNDPAVLKALINSMYEAARGTLPELSNPEREFPIVRAGYMGRVYLTENFLKHINTMIQSLSELELIVALSVGEGNDYIEVYKEVRRRKGFENTDNPTLRTTIRELVSKGVLYVERLTEEEYESYAQKLAKRQGAGCPA